MLIGLPFLPQNAGSPDHHHPNRIATIETSPDSGDIYEGGIVKNLLLLAAILAASLMAGNASAASSHRNGCHTKHTCPSDHHTYKWRGLSCASPTSPKYNRARDKIVVRHLGRKYYCRKG